LASLGIFDSEPVLERNAGIAARMDELAAPLREHPNVAEVRQTGMILAIEMVADGKTRRPFAAQDRRGLRAYRHALAQGVVLRPLGDILYWMPPYCIDEEGLQHLAAVTLGALNEATR
jgi:adenosylmethionine-8-amino-7-oxononanoate aminotransferase